MKFTNTQPGPRGVNTVAGIVLIDPKATADNLRVFEREREGLVASGWFEIEGDYERNPAPGSAPATAVEAAATEGVIRSKDNEIARLNADIGEKDKRIAELEKLVAETDIDKMTVPELRAFLAFHDVGYDGKKDDLLAKAKTVKVA